MDASQLPAATSRTWQEIVLHIFPENIAKAVVDGEILQVVVFSVIFGSALAMVGEARRRPMLAFAESLAETMFKFTGIVMLLAPLGVGCGHRLHRRPPGRGRPGQPGETGRHLLRRGRGVRPGGAAADRVGRAVPLRRFARAVAEPVSIAFATTSSEAALPRAMEAMERLGVPRQIVAFVMPTGYSFNLDGSTLYLSLTALFVAQAAGVELTVGQQLLLLLTLMLTSKGVAGVPRGALVILMGTVASFGLPVEPVFMILGIDALLDMVRTSVNVLGNCLATVVIARWEGEFHERPEESAAS